MGLRHAFLKQMWFLHIQKLSKLFTHLRKISIPYETKAERKVYPTMNNAHEEQVTQLPSTQKDSYHSTGIDDRRV
jgi:hypothetical protein